MHDKGTIAYRRKDYDGALRLYFGAFDEYGDDGRGTDRVLADIALAFQDLGDPEMARGMLQELAEYSVEESQRWTATVNLMRLEAEADDEPRFNALRRRLVGVRLTPHNRAHYYLIAGKAWRHFGRPGLAQRALTRASDVIGRYGLRNLEAELSALKQDGADAHPEVGPRVTDKITHDLRLFLPCASAARTRWSGARRHTSAPTYTSGGAESVATGSLSATAQLVGRSRGARTAHDDCGGDECDDHANAGTHTTSGLVK